MSTQKDSPAELLFVALLVVAAFAGFFYVIFHFWIPITPLNIAAAIAGTLAYLFICYKVDAPSFDPDELRPQFHFSFMDRYEQDLNWWAFAFTIFLFPGMILSQACVELVKEIRRRI